MKRIQKLSNQKDKRQEELEKLENGFNLFTNGAHQGKEKYTPRYTTAAKSSLNSKKSQQFATPRTSRTNTSASPLLRHFEKQQQQQQHTSANSRKKWANSSFTIKTTDGCQIKIHAPNHYESKGESSNNRMLSNDCTEYYSDDFESDESEVEADKGLIESVMFSDDDDDDDDDEAAVKSKRFVFHLSREEAKLVRESINGGIRESLVRMVKRDFPDFSDLCS